MLGCRGFSRDAVLGGGGGGGGNCFCGERKCGKHPINKQNFVIVWGGRGEFKT